MHSSLLILCLFSFCVTAGLLTTASSSLSLRMQQSDVTLAHQSKSEEPPSSTDVFLFCCCLRFAASAHV